MTGRCGYEDASVYPQGSNNYRFNVSGIGCWLTILAIALLLGPVGLVWVLKSLTLLIVVLITVPILAFLVGRWWLNRNLIQGNCPVCQTPLAGLRQAQTSCPNCRTPLQVTQHGFERFTPDGTVEVSAVDVTANDTTARANHDAIDVSVEVLPPVEGEL